MREEILSGAIPGFLLISLAAWGLLWISVVVLCDEVAILCDEEVKGDDGVTDDADSFPSLEVVDCEDCIWSPGSAPLMFFLDKRIKL